MLSRAVKGSGVAVVGAIAVFLTSCGGQVSDEEFEAVQRELGTAQSRVRSLEATNQELLAREITRKLEQVGDVISIDELMVFPPTVVEITHNSANLQMITKVPTTCAIAHGLTTVYGLISTDDSMTPGGHTDHYHALEGLHPDTVYHYKWGLLGPAGTLYGSDDLTFKTPPAQTPSGG